ncbi:retinoic acid-induced protein 2 [Thalassophryne amazonica]|uniref:retinoic acid-induced protein 2 n=1 Tax=Thalassophryne amazonica TaxID=390379 RepID=UPI001472260F|nr:retinoic acid-induced protein 2 [Thalassophryne amazonica]
MEGSDHVSTAIEHTQTDVCTPEVEGGGEFASKVESGVSPLTPSDSCNGSAAAVSKGRLSNLVEAPAPSVVSATADSPGGVALKVATTVLHPVCLGDNPLMLPIHLQMAGTAGAQLGQVGAAPYLISQSPVSLPLVLDQQVLQHLSPSVMPPTANCPSLSLQNSVLCQNPLTFSLPPTVEQKGVGPAQDANLLSVIQNPAFAAILQDLFTSQATSSTCQSPGSTFFPLPPLTPPYTSPLAPLVPPATLLVPYPVIIPLPVPLPIPLPIPIPVPQTEDSKGNMTTPVCTVSKSTQTYLKDATSPSLFSSKWLPPFHQQNVSQTSIPLEEGQALDLSVRTCPVEPKHEYPCLQDSVLDLSVGGVRKKCVQSCNSGEREFAFQHGQDSSGTTLSLGVECTQSLDSKLLGSLTSLEFSRQHKWVVDSSAGTSSSLGQEASLSGAGNLEIVSTSQTAKVIVSVKDAIPAILCGKIKGLSGVSTKNFSIKRDGSRGASLHQLYGVPSISHREQHDHNDPLKKVPKNRGIKLKKVSSQQIHFLPIKKQRLAALLPRK